MYNKKIGTKNKFIEIFQKNLVKNRKIVYNNCIENKIKKSYKNSKNKKC